jgi:hypothetical protein
MNVRLQCGGIDAATWAELEAMPCPRGGDVYACVVRYGTWEYPTDEAVAMRAHLASRGYRVFGTDPAAWWCNAWLRSETDTDRGIPPEVAG